MEAEDHEFFDRANTAPYWQNSTDSDILNNFNGTGPDKVLLNNVTTSIPFIPLGIGLIVVTLFGIVGNCLSAVVLSSKRLQSSYSVLTLGLTFVDSVYLVMKFLRYGIESLFQHYEIAKTYSHWLLPVTGPYLRALTFTAHTASTYFTIAIAVDRYIAVCWPSIARKYCTRKCARLVSFLVILWSFAFNATRWLEFTTVEIGGQVTETSQMTDSVDAIYMMKMTDLRTHPVYLEVYIFWVYLVIMFIVPFITLSVLNLFIFLGIRKMVKDGVVLTSTQRRDTSFSIMLIGVVVVFLLCNVDYLVLDVLNYCNVPFSEFWNHLGNFLLTINSAINFLIYCVCGWKFRHELGKLIRKTCPCFQQRGSTDIAVTDECQWVKDTMNMDLQSIPRVSLSKATSKNHM